MQTVLECIKHGKKCVPRLFFDNKNTNPFNNATAIRYDLKANARMRIAPYDVRGIEVAVLKDGFENAGTHVIHCDGQQLPSGLYVYQITATSDKETFQSQRQMVLIK